jgi:hypothetical protein
VSVTVIPAPSGLIDTARAEPIWRGWQEAYPHAKRQQEKRQAQMKKHIVFAGLATLLLAAAASAQNPQVFDLPKFTQAPILDGDRASVIGEWNGALEMACSPSQVIIDGGNFGWRDQEAQQSEVSVNQLSISENEDAAEGRTDADYSSQIYQGWDDEAFYFLIEARDNFRDDSGAAPRPTGGRGTACASTSTWSTAARSGVAPATSTSAPA